MKRRLILVPLLLLLSAPALAQLEGSCCACVAQFNAHTSQASPSANAFFCRFVDSGVAGDAFDAQCAARPGIGVCLAMVGSGTALNAPDCSALLESELGIGCPAAKGVPAAASWSLGLLALALLALGAWLGSPAARRTRAS